MASLIPDFSGVTINTAGAMKNYLDASNAVATSINKPLDRITALVESNELARKTKLAEEKQAAQDARQVIADQQNKQLFDLKMEDANRAKQDLVDKDAYLKGIVNPNTYGLKAGTEGIVTALGSYGDDARTQAAIAAGPGSAEYEAHFKTMENLGNYITGKSLDDRTIGFATANPNNRYAAEEAIKASIARQNALDKEAKDVADDQLKYKLESLKQLGKGSTGVSEDGTSTSKVGMTAGGYKVSSPDDVLKDANTIMKDNYGLKSDSPMDARVVKLASRMSNSGYSASQIAEVIGTNYTPGKTEKLFGLVDSLWPDKAAVFNDIAPNVGAPKNMAVPTATNKEYTDTLSGLSQSYADRLAKIQEQRDGTYGMDKFRELLNGPANKYNTQFTPLTDVDGVFRDKVLKTETENNDYTSHRKSKDGTTETLGAYQFVPSTLNNLKKELGEEFTNEEFLKNPALQDKYFQVLTDKNAGQLKSQGLPVNDRTLWLMHNLGGGGQTANFLSDEPLTEETKKAIALNLPEGVEPTRDNYIKRFGDRFGTGEVTPKTTVKDLFAKVEEKKVEDKITTDFSKLNDEDIQTGIEVYTGAEKEAYQKEAIRRRVEKLNYNNTVHAAPIITTEPEVQKEVRSGFQMLRDTMVQGAQDTYNQGKKGVKEFVVPLVKPAYDAVFGDKPSPEARTAIALVNNSAGGMLEIAGSPYTAAKRFTDFMVYGESQGDTVFQKQAEVARDTAIKEMNKLGITDPTKQEIALFVSDSIMPIGPLSKTGSMIRNSLKNPSANIDNIVARIDDFNKITPSGTAKLDAASAEAAAAVRKSSAAEKLAGVKRSEEYAKDAAEFEARALQQERQAATNIPKDVRDAVEATIKAHADEAPIIQSVSETLQGIGGRGVLSQADEVVILNSLEKLQGLSSKSTIEVLRELKLSPKVERYIMDTFNQKR